MLRRQMKLSPQARCNATIGAGPVDRRAANRPADELNAAPFNAVQFSSSPGNALAIDPFLWQDIGLLLLSRTAPGCCRRS
jgi:hypothetical protein